MKDDIYDIPMVYLLYVLLAVVAIVAVAVIVIIRMLQAPLRRILIERQHDSRIDRHFTITGEGLSSIPNHTRSRMCPDNISQ
jgi:hypothetical protein